MVALPLAAHYTAYEASILQVTIGQEIASNR
jgi:hypothetical protein